MKKIATLFLVLSISIATAQKEPVNIVFDVSSKNIKVQKSTVRHALCMSKAYPESKFEIVIYSEAIHMVLSKRSSVFNEIQNLLNRTNVDVFLCEGTMTRKKIKSNQIINGIKTVPDGLLEIALKQQEGWSYIKETF